MNTWRWLQVSGVHGLWRVLACEPASFDLLHCAVCMKPVHTHCRKVDHNYSHTPHEDAGMPRKCLHLNSPLFFYLELPNVPCLQHMYFTVFCTVLHCHHGSPRFITHLAVSETSNLPCGIALTSAGSLILLFVHTTWSTSACTANHCATPEKAVLCVVQDASGAVPSVRR